MSLSARVCVCMWQYVRALLTDLTATTLIAKLGVWVILTAELKALSWIAEKQQTH